MKPSPTTNGTRQIAAGEVARLVTVDAINPWALSIMHAYATRRSTDPCTILVKVLPQHGTLLSINHPSREMVGKADECNKRDLETWLATWRLKTYALGRLPTIIHQSGITFGTSYFFTSLQKSASEKTNPVKLYINASVQIPEVNQFTRSNYWFDQMKNHDLCHQTFAQRLEGGDCREAAEGLHQ